METKMKHYITIVRQWTPQLGGSVVAKGNGATEAEATAVAHHNFSDEPFALENAIKERGEGNSEFQYHIWNYTIEI